MKFFYQEAANKPGIYKIINTHTDRVYIGQAKNFKKRWHGHKSSLLNNKNQNKFLLNDYNKCKSELNHDDFLEFHVLEVMENSTKDERNKREEEIIAEFWDKQENCYNFKQKIKAKERSCISKIKTIDEIREESSKKFKNLWSNPEYKNAMSKSAKVFWNTEEGKQLATERNLKAWQSEERKESTSVRLKKEHAEGKRNVNGLLNQDRSKAIATKKLKFEQNKTYKTKMQEIARTNIAFYNTTQPVKTYGSLVDPNGIIYKNISHVPTFAKTHGLIKTHLYSLLLGKIKSHKGWQLIA